MKAVGRLWSWFWGHWVRLPVLACLAAVTLVALATAAALHISGSVDEAAPADVIVVLGAGVEEDARATEATTRRAAHAAALFHAGYAPAVICSGGFAIDRPISEAEACASVLVGLGVPRRAIWIEDQSKSTEENALYTRVLMAGQGWQRAVIVTDSFHVLRARLLFERYGVTVAGLSPAQVTTGPLPLADYLWQLRREVMGLFWEGFKTIFGLPFTRVDFL